MNFCGKPDIKRHSPYIHYLKSQSREGLQEIAEEDENEDIEKEGDEGEEKKDKEKGEEEAEQTKKEVERADEDEKGRRI